MGYKVMQKYQKQIIVISLILLFTAVFFRDVKLDFRLIFQKDLLAHDESSNSVVSANITRKFFPPMVRVNPLDGQQGNWMEGPYWQHIPPLFAYVPYIFFKIDGQVSIEVKRLAYAFVIWLTGLLFITIVYRYKRSLLAALSAFIACVFWIKTPFTHELITGYAFGASDIVLAFTIVCAFGAIIEYLKGEQQQRRQYPWWKLLLMGAIMALPIMAKNLLGAIPAATYFLLLLRDQFVTPSNSPFQGENNPVAVPPLKGEVRRGRLLVASSGFMGLLFLYYSPLYLSSPVTFKNEILVSFYHFKPLEGWARPWHWYITNYLPQRYLFGWTWVYYSGLILSLGANVWWWTRKQEGRRYRTTLVVSLVWFIWNLLAVSLVTSKVPNFIYQSYLLSLFFVIYGLGIFVISLRSRIPALNHPGISQSENSFWRNIRDLFERVPGWALVGVLVLTILLTGYETVRFGQQFKIYRARAYNYQSEHEKFYQTAEQLQKLGVGTDDFIIVRISDNDCWFRYYPLFLTGTETKTLLEMYFGFDASAIKRKYRRMFFIHSDFSLRKFDIANMTTEEIWSRITDFINENKSDIEKNILRIKKDKTSCQWLVPDRVLNTP